jgi:hypothetical protein
MSGWFLVCVITIRVGTAFSVETKEHQMPSYDRCIEEKVRMEKVLALPILRGHRSYTLDCEYRP